MKRPNYYPALEVIAEQLRPGDVVEVNVEHDEDCGIFAGDPCDCEPAVLANTINEPTQEAEPDVQGQET